MAPPSGAVPGHRGKFVSVGVVTSSVAPPASPGDPSVPVGRLQACCVVVAKVAGRPGQGNGVNVKSLMTTSAGWPFDGATPRKSHRFIRAFSPPGRGTSGPE